MLKKWTITFNVDEEQLKIAYGSKNIKNIIKIELENSDICFMYIDKIEKMEDKINDKDIK